MNQLDCAKYVICYKDAATSEVLTLAFLFVAALLLTICVTIVNIKLKEKIEKDKKLKKKFIDEGETWTNN
jgi:hypothetical protein